MTREYDDGLVELGVASVDTKGATLGRDDEEVGQQFIPGLTRD